MRRLGEFFANPGGDLDLTDVPAGAAHDDAIEAVERTPIEPVGARKHLNAQDADGHALAGGRRAGDHHITRAAGVVEDIPQGHDGAFDHHARLDLRHGGQRRAEDRGAEQQHRDQ